jgi:hypothetical protein
VRTTVTLTPEAEALVRQAMRERGLTFKEAVNAAIVSALSRKQASTTSSTPTFELGSARTYLDRAVTLAAELEDDELSRKRSMGK